ncbi:MAG: GTPase Era [Bacilli bacterium]|nr:GTPase Era [Bacilli bacterium]MBO6286356.1 GTPase Era [Bacilli bacterium]
MKSGFVAILGRPNVGKSTLINALLSKKVSIVSPKAQTTRDAISGIYEDSSVQIVFVDTPGIHQGDKKLDSHMRRSAFSSSREVDCILYLFDASDKDIEADFKVIDSINSEAPKIFVLNKIDLVRPEIGKGKIEAIKEKYPDTQIIEASFKENFGLKEIKNAVIPYLSGEVPFYPSDMLTDKDTAYQAKEVIREKLLHFLRDEIPHSSAVKVTKIDLKKEGYVIAATIILDKENHKGIVIGKNGAMIKKISMASRQELERMWRARVASLVLQVEVVPGWRDNIAKLNDIGYGDR